MNQLSIWNTTDLINMTRYNHPILYCAAIYALFLIIIGTIGKFIS